MKDLNEIQDAKLRLEDSNTPIGTAYIPARKPELESIKSEIIDEDRLKQAYGYLDDLFKIYVLPSITKLAADLKIDIDTLIRIFARKETIGEDLARKLTYLHAIKLGSVYVPRPKVELEPIDSSLIDEAQPRLKELIRKMPIEELARKLKTTPAQIQAFLDNKESVPLDTAKAVMYLWAIKCGSVYAPAPKPILEPIDSSLIDEAQSLLLDLLKNIPIQELAIKLKIGHAQITNYLENMEPISLDIASKLRFIWQIVYGTSYYPGHKSSIDELLECSIFVDVYRFVGKNNKSYKVSNAKDVLPNKIEDGQYDNALKRVMPKINEIIYIFFNKNLKIEQINEINPEITPVCPKYRKFDLEIINEVNVVDYFLIYSRGVLIDCTEGFPFEKIVAVLKNEQSWES